MNMAECSVKCNQCGVIMWHYSSLGCLVATYQWCSEVRSTGSQHIHCFPSLLNWGVVLTKCKKTESAWVLLVRRFTCWQFQVCRCLCLKGHYLRNYAAVFFKISAFTSDLQPPVKNLHNAEELVQVTIIYSVVSVLSTHGVCTKVTWQMQRQLHIIHVTWRCTLSCFELSVWAFLLLSF